MSKKICYHFVTLYDKIQRGEDAMECMSNFHLSSFLYHWSTNFNIFFLARALTTDSYRVLAADSESVLRFAPSHQVFELFDILYLSMFIC